MSETKHIEAFPGEVSRETIVDSVKKARRKPLGSKKMRDQTVLDQLLAGASVFGAAQAAGVNEAYVLRLLSDQQFRGRRLDAQRAKLGVFTARIVQLGAGAVGVLEELARKAEDPNVRLRAAQILTDKAERLVFDHPEFKAASASTQPMFVLPAGTRVMAMIGRAPAEEVAPPITVDAELAPVPRAELEDPIPADGDMPRATQAELDQSSIMPPLNPRPEES